MKARWFHLFSALALLGALTLVGCGPKEVTPPAGKVQSPQSYDQEMKGETPAPADAPAAGDAKPADAKPAVAPAAGEEKPADAKPEKAK